jgi:hypothetical protein
MKEIFQNKVNDSNRFISFMEQIAKRIQMENWKGYRGDMGTSGDDVARDSFYTEWRGIHVMFHVAPYMNAEQHRRLVGNDIAVIIYYDEDDTSKGVQLFSSGDLGIVPHVFSVVQPHATDHTRYRVGFFRRPTVPKFGPATPPKDCYLKLTEKPSNKNLKDFLLTKIHNGLVSAQSVSPLNRLYTVPRREALKDLGAKYPKMQNSNLFVDFPIGGPIGNIGGALGGAAGAIGNTLGNTITGVLGGMTEEKLNPNTPKLKVKILRGFNLASKDSNGYSDPYVRVIFGGKELKTKVIHKTLTPMWEDELEFEYPEDDTLEEIHIICMDWDKVGGHDFMGEYHAYIKNIPYSEKVRFPLLVTTIEEATGEIELEISKMDPSRARTGTLALKNISELGKAKSSNKRSPRGKDDSIKKSDNRNLPLETSGIERSPAEKVQAAGVAAVSTLGRALSKIPRAHSEKEKKRTLKKNQFDRLDDEDYSESEIQPVARYPSVKAKGEDRSELSDILYSRSTNDIHREMKKLALKEESFRTTDSISTPNQQHPYRSLTPRSQEQLERMQRETCFANTPPRPAHPAPQRAGTINIKRTHEFGDLHEKEKESSTSEDDTETSHTVTTTITLGSQGRSLSSDKIPNRVVQQKRAPAYNPADLTSVLEEVKNAVEELIVEALKENVNKESALKAATNMRSHLQRLADIIELESDDSPLKDNTLQMMSVAKVVLKNCLEYVRYKLAGADAKHLLPSLKQSSAEFTQYVLITTKLVYL